MTIYNDFRSIPADFMGSIYGSGNTSLFLSPEWFHNYIETVVENRDRVSLFATEIENANESRLLLPLYDEISQSVLDPRRLSGLANYYSSCLEPLLASTGNTSSRYFTNLVSEISNHDPGWDVVDISPCNPERVSLSNLSNAFSEQNWMVQEYYCFENLYLKNSYVDFASYLATRSTRVRKTAANRTRSFDKNRENSFEIVTSIDEIESGMKVFSELYEKRWGQKEPYPDFMPGLAKVCAKNGWLRLGIAKVNGRAAAAQFWIVKDAVAYIYKVAYDTEYTKQSIGSVALFKMFQHVLDNESVYEVDFLTGGQAYKKDWMSDSRTMAGLIAFNKRTVRGIASAFRHIGGQVIRKKLQLLTGNNRSSDRATK